MPAKLLVVSGPNKGATYFLQDGETTLGRAPDVDIVLASNQVSKRHCSFSSSNGGRKVDLKDLGSSNGTFVNGVLAKQKSLKSQDKISLGPFVLQLILPAMQLKAASNVSQDTGFMHTTSASISMEPQKEVPKSIIARLKMRFDEVVLPVMYGFYEKYDYPTLFVTMFAIFILLNVGFTVAPVLERSHEEVLREAEARAIYIAKQISYMNRQFIQEGKETSLNVDFADAEVNVKEAKIVNLDGRIMAPAARLNEMDKSSVVLKYKDALLKNSQLWNQPYYKRRSEGAITVIVPIMVLSKTKGINVPGALSVVNFSTSGISLDSGTQYAIYFETIITTVLLGAIFLYLLYQITFQPIRMLNQELEKRLQGEGELVEKKYKSEVINSLIDTVNFALGKIPKASSSAGEMDMGMGGNEQAVADNLVRSFDLMLTKLKFPVMMLDADKRIKFANEAFEELTGIRGAVGDVLENVSRDESFPSLIKEMMEKSVHAGNEGVFEDYDFSSGTLKVHALGLSGIPGKMEGYIFLFEKAEG